jgi:hypothetical protein
LNKHAPKAAAYEDHNDLPRNGGNAPGRIRLEPTAGSIRRNYSADIGLRVFTIMSDTEMIEWIAHVGAQIWKDRKGNWTVQVMHGRQYPIQPTRATLRAAIVDACNEWMEEPHAGPNTKPN